MRPESVQHHGARRSGQRRGKAKEDERRRSARTRQQEEQLSLVTQNVQGLASGDASTSWFAALMQEQDGQQADMVLIQETHVQADEIERFTGHHCRMWGLDDSQHSTPLAYWSASNGRRAGVATLLNPHAAIHSVAPYQQDSWTPNFMAVSARLDGETFVVINIYAPTDKNQRELLYQRLARLELPQDARVLVGGDFNCTQDLGTDRSYNKNQASHYSKMLDKVIVEWGLKDAAEDDMKRVFSPLGVGRFAARHRTYFYKLADGTEASCRLDRWYISSSDYDWVRDVAATLPNARTDHNGVRLLINNPTHRHLTRRREIVYPAPVYAAQEVELVHQRLIADFAARVKAHDGTVSRDQAIRWAVEWDELKITLVSKCREIWQKSKRKVRTAYRQRLRRLNSAVRALGVTRGGRQPKRDAEESVLELRSSLLAMKAQASTQRRLQLFARHSSQESTKVFFGRIANRYLDTAVTELIEEGQDTACAIDDMQDVMASGWQDVMAPQLVSIDWESAAVSEFHAPRQDGLDVLNNVIVEDETRRSLRRSARGKAAGPDKLPNSWYRDFEDALVPLLTRLFNAWLRHAVFPKSFATAYILCTKKSRRSVLPKDFRPIAQLCSDYKIFARLMAMRVRGLVERLVHWAQNGFAPGRDIHATIDYFMAAQKLARQGMLPPSACALFVDFSKAYDTLRRDCLLWVLRCQGFPPLFIQMVHATHRETTSQFIVNGKVLRSVAVTTGIRQGCPLAPLLFILALSPLYTALQADARLPGRNLGVHHNEETLRSLGMPMTLRCNCKTSARRQRRSACSRVSATSPVYSSTRTRRCVCVSTLQNRSSRVTAWASLF